MGRVIRSPRARQDVLEIGRYIAQDNRDAALQFLTKIDDAIDLLSRFPGGGPAREDLGREFRSFPVGNYLIVYKKIPDGILILTVAHGGQDLPERLKDLS